MQEIVSYTYTSTRSTFTPQGSVASSREACRQQQQQCTKCNHYKAAQVMYVVYTSMLQMVFIVNPIYLVYI